MGLFSKVFGSDDDAANRSLLGSIGDRTTQFLRGDLESTSRPAGPQDSREQLLSRAKRPLDPEYEELAKELVGILEDKLDISELSDADRTRVVMIGVQMYAEQGLEGMQLLEQRVLSLMGPVWIVQDAWRQMRRSGGATE